jgi:hypothetical protein
MERLIRIVAAIGALCLIADTAWAWGQLGHSIVGEIGERHLKPDTARQLARLLKNDLGADGIPSGRTTLAQVGGWPDEIRGRPIGVGKEAWHFVDLEVCRPAHMRQACPDAQCAPEQLKRMVRILKNKSLDDGERNEALKWVVHLMADIHQPLHASDHDDHGGNRVAVSFFGSAQLGETTNLHRIWDTDMVERMVGEAGGQAVFVAIPVSPADKARWESGSIDEWVEESHHIAASFVYPRLPGGFACDQEISRTVEIGAGYYNAAAPIIAAQLRKAGVRLAAVLNAVLGSTGP